MPVCPSDYVLQLPFIGGRIAIRRGLKLCSRSRTEMKGKGNTEPVAPVAAILHDCYGAPLLPKGLSASISHKRHLAVAIVQPGCAGNLGGCIRQSLRSRISYKCEHQRHDWRAKVRTSVLTTVCVLDCYLQDLPSYPVRAFHALRNPGKLVPTP